MLYPIDPFQHTLKKTISCCGIGLHSGKNVNLTIKPAPVNSGITFYRQDLPGSSPIKAHMDKVIDTQLATTLGEGKATISTTEHLLAAIRAFGIDNADIEVDAKEIPIMDGSAGPFMTLLQAAGKFRQHSPRKVLRITKDICYANGDTLLTIKPYNGFKISEKISFDAKIISTQSYSLEVTQDRFANEISKARTFGNIQQVEELWAHGLALGGTLENVIAIDWNGTSILNEGGLRYKDEFVRHKILDLIGDMSLLGCPILGHIEAYKSGHTQHALFMKEIAHAANNWELVELSNNGSYSVLDKVISGTRAAGEMIMLPFLQKTPLSAA